MRLASSLVFAWHALRTAARPQYSVPCTVVSVTMPRHSKNNTANAFHTRHEMLAAG